MNQDKPRDPAELLETMKTYIQEMKKVDPRGYKDWVYRLVNLEEDFKKDLKQAIRWASFKED